MEPALHLIIVFLLLGFAKAAPTFAELNAAELFSSPHEIVGDNLREWMKDKKRKGNAEEQGSYFEGDLILGTQTLNGLETPEKTWVGQKIPYVIEGTFSTREKKLIREAISMFMTKTCLFFVKRSKEVDYIVFRNAPTGCHSMVGKVGGPQIINLQSTGCTTKIGTTVHEILHALGFYHEQNRSDRDDFVKINSNNIEPGMELNFRKLPETSSKILQYDYGSVLHYSPYAFSINSKKTIKAVGDKSNEAKMGQRNGFSNGDIEKVKAKYCTSD